MRRFAFRLFSAALFLSLPAAASAADLGHGLTLSGSAALTSDYVFRGVTQNDERVTPQLGIEIGHESGVYAGLWTSAVEFADAEAEVDATIGYRYEKNNWSGDLRYVHYFYPGSAPSLNYNYGEFIFSGAYDFSAFSLGALFAYSPEFYGNSGHAEYVQARLDVPLPSDFSFYATLGHQYIEDNTAFGLPNYSDWGFGVSYSLASLGAEGLKLDVGYTDTDLTKAECASGCSGRVIGTLTYAF